MDICRLSAEAALARGAELHVVMPFSIADFRAASVAIGDADGEEGWNNRFDAAALAALPAAKGEAAAIGFLR